MSSSLGLLIAAITGLYLCICMFFVFQQSRLIFPGATNDSRMLSSVEHTPLSLNSNDALLSGFSRHFENTDNKTVVLYFGGNAEDISLMLYLSDELGVSEFYSFNYRGYGSSNGSPSEKSLIEDAWAQFEFLTVQKEISPEKIIVVGRSLGSGVAVKLAQQVQFNGQSLAGVVLITPYDSLLAVAGQHYPWLPVRWLLKHPFDSLSVARQLNVPALFMIAGKDRVIPPHHGQNLAQAWFGPSDTEVFANYDHNNLDESPTFYPLLRKFIRKVSSEYQADDGENTP
ncbi:alpha/beta hydrolase [Endozoicomonas arenosclerae]|uniref:alpha/beta hydrolase n=1 Tax=Endozoicomonas arenosclerae TaxID=1633495 RepID=UPI000A9DB480|nr:alpha/beta fold hydrolase [Endozoicomonas arenosclerae]